ncbi:MAG TPA: DEAD/DEAH box helicase [Acidimicrobiales bacterium]|nr:DEAD/DEAH box helicase [Acidimicrobiales bacterium]
MSEIRRQFVAGLGFAPDGFQAAAMDSIDQGHSVLVAAPTGSGKTVVAEYAIERAVAEGGKAFYTTPLKALSNQKFTDPQLRHGPTNVGLLTGDNAINPTAPVVVMTTEVLRNMIYAGSSTLDNLRWVVLDEVHYLQNPYRGAVWEEVIIHLPLEVNLVCLSATVSNAEDFADWIATVRGATDPIIEEHRPVELEHLYLVGERDSERLHLMPTFVDDGRPNPRAAELDSRMAAGGSSRYGKRRHLYTPRRVEVAHVLWDEHMLPAIYFIFSRKACDEAVRQCLQSGVRFTTAEERAEIRAVAEAYVGGLADTDLDVLGYDAWLSGLESGIASHHAGLVPPFKEAVEQLFERALVKLVFATETLSLGINMPARSVVIEKLTKFTGETHQKLTPGEYTQFTGRAGRRGIDDIGYAVVLWSPWVAFEEAAGLASRRTYALTSSFRPTYNMATNLIRRYQPDTARHLLNLSFAQYRSDSDVVKQEASLERLRGLLAKSKADATCELGDAKEYAQLVRAADQEARQRPSEESQIVEAMARLKPGDILVVPGKKARGRVAIVSTSERGSGRMRLAVVTQDGRRIQLSPKDFLAPPRAVGVISLPMPFAPNNHKFLAGAAETLRRARVREDGLVGVESHSRHGRRQHAVAVNSAADAHPVARCPEARVHLRAARSVARLEREIESHRRVLRSRTESLARQLDRVLDVLEWAGMVDGWALTGAGERLSRIYHECDLLIADCLDAGLLDGLSAPELAGLVSMFTFESRTSTQSAPPPGGELERRARQIVMRHAGLAGNEEAAKLPVTREPDPGFISLAQGWAQKRPLATLLGDEELPAGDFVRNVKQLIDLLRQLALVAPDADTARAAGEAATALFHGVIMASSSVGGP